TWLAAAGSARPRDPSRRGRRGPFSRCGQRTAGGSSIVRPVSREVPDGTDAYFLRSLRSATLLDVQSFRKRALPSGGIRAFPDMDIHQQSGIFVPSGSGKAGQRRTMPRSVDRRQDSSTIGRHMATQAKKKAKTKKKKL